MTTLQGKRQAWSRWPPAISEYGKLRKCSEKSAFLQCLETIDKPMDVGPCNHEEADTRLFLHVKDASNKGMKIVKVSTVDTDVIVLAFNFFHDLFLSEFWIEYGTGKNRRWLPICKPIPFWFAMTGCDTVLMFAGRGKKTSWDA